ncbi:hypothetical protein DPMN_129834 [Dreissena polymorpha]|uniref:Uncharacterized protein n=1 Tax=Dreissena polymorpha TaxID=45954 RepID=A0A9D4H3J2_DREPO|nr:hypothetical protein DPMN_129834 [Dreissena polymorpha]
MYVSQTVAYTTDGRVLCVSGSPRMQNHRVNSCEAYSFGETGCDSDTSGYSSTSSIDSVEEERRVAPSEEKIKSVWKCWSQHLNSFSGPRCSTPKPDSENVVLKKRVKLRYFSRPLTAVKKMLCSHSSDRDTLVLNSCCIRNPFSPACVLKIRAKQVANMRSLDSGLNFKLSARCQSSVKEDRKCPPCPTPSFYVGGKLITVNRAYNERVSTEDRQTGNRKPRLQARGLMLGESLDESMAEFLSNVNQQNLASYLQFYDVVTKNANHTPSYFKV